MQHQEWQLEVVHYAIGSQNETKLQKDLGSKANSKHLTAWVTRKFGKTNFHLTQLLTGYGCFAHYLYRFKLLNCPTCINCEAPVEDVKHTFFQCDQWWNKRRLLEDQLEQDLNPDNLISIMLKSEQNWKTVNGYIREILKEKKEEEKQLQKEMDAVLIII